MKNIEKYKGIVLKHLSHCDIETDIRKQGGKAAIDCPHTSCEECQEKFFKWLLEEYKNPILTDAERKYLSAEIKPFREKIECIFKAKLPNFDEYYIIVGLKDNDSLRFLCFKGNTMYKGMEVDKEYELEELGL